MNTPPLEPNQANAQNTTPPTTPTPTNETPPASLEELANQLAATKREAQSLRKRFRDQEEAQQAAEQERLKKQGEFEQLAKQHEARVKELEPISERYGQLASILAEQIKVQTKDWPAELKAFDPGADAPIEQRLEWVHRSEPLIAKLQQQVRATTPGNAPNPRPAGNGSQSQDVDTLRQRYRETGKYSF